MAEDKKEAKPKAKNTGKIIALLFFALNLAVLGIGSYLTYASTLGWEPPMTSEQELNKELIEFRRSLASEPLVYTLGSFGTNLNGLPRRFIKVEVNLEMLDEAGFEEVINKSSKAKDSVMRILNAKEFNDLETVQGKLHLKNQMITQLNSFLDRGVVKNVYFTKFQVQ